MKKIRLLAIAALASLVGFSCAANPVTGKKELMLVSEAQEIEMGRDFYPNSIWSGIGGGGEYQDAELKTYLKSIVFDIHKISHRPNLPVDFAIQNSSVPNAWAIPGYVVITRGLLAGLESEAEYAFVMGHEMGHVSARHSASQMSYSMLQQAGLAAAGIALGGSGYQQAAVTAGAIGTTLVMLKYGREDELEADGLGLEYMAKLGYDTKNSVTAHKNLERVADDYMRSLGKDPSQGAFFEELLSTHPRTSVRIDELEKMRAKFTVAKLRGDGTAASAFKQKTAGIREKNRIYRDYYDKAVLAVKDKKTTEASNLIKQAIEKDPGEPPFHVLKGFLALEEKSYAEARKSFNAALGIDPGYEPALRGIGALLFLEGKYSEAVTSLERALKIYPQDPTAFYYLGMSYYHLKNYESALKYLAPYAEASPKDPKIHYYVGASFEGLRSTKNAYIEYVNQINVAPDTEEGRLARERVRALKPIIEQQQQKPRRR
jgi:predicted Zn-dependent protease